MPRNPEKLLLTSAESILLEKPHEKGLVRSERNFINLLKARQISANTLFCQGLDPNWDKLPDVIKKKYPDTLKGKADAYLDFNIQIMDAVAPYACAFKPQSSYYEALGQWGIETLGKTIEYAHKNYSEIVVPLDAKRGDIGSTTDEYAKAVYDVLQADGCTLNPYLGFEALQPFLNRADKGAIILCRTSNPGAKDFQDSIDKETNLPLYQLVAKKALEHDTNGNILLVVGATYPEEMKHVRNIVGDQIPFLVPGIEGPQGGKPEYLKNGLDSQGFGILASVSRGTLYASSGPDFAKAAGEKAKEIRDKINAYR